VRNGEMIVLIDDALRQKHVIARLRTVSYDKYVQRKARWSQRLSEGVLRRRLNRQPLTFLQKLEAQCDEINYVR
jgi:hypothetical protein